MNWKPCAPRPNRVYRNYSGDLYSCLGNSACTDTARRLFGDDVALDLCDGVCERLSDHWLVLARNVQVNEDGDICWDYSIGGGWRYPGEPTYGGES